MDDLGVDHDGASIMTILRKTARMQPCMEMRFQSNWLLEYCIRKVFADHDNIEK